MQALVTVGYKKLIFDSAEEAGALVDLLAKARCVDWEFDKKSWYFDSKIDVALEVGNFDIQSSDAHVAYKAKEAEARNKRIAEREAAKEAAAVLTANPQYGDPTPAEVDAEADSKAVWKEACEEEGPTTEGYGEPCEGRR